MPTQRIAASSQQRQSGAPACGRFVGPILTALVLTVFASCGGDSPDGDRRSAGVSPSCNEAAQHAAGSAPTRSIRGDVDGDGSTDQVWVFAAASEEPLECRYWLLARRKTATDIAAIRHRSIREEAEGSSSVRLTSLRTVDDRPGAEVIVAVASGAHARAYAVFSHRGVLTELQNDEERGEFATLFVAGSSLTGGEGIACVPDQPGRLVEVGAGPTHDKAGSWLVVRRLLELEGTRFRYVGASRQHVVDLVDVTKVAPEIDAPVLANCATGETS